MADKILAKELTINGSSYEVNAVEADHVKNTLKIKSIGFDNKGNEKVTEEVQFNGANTAEVSIVSAKTGGRFKKEIRVPNKEASAVLNDETVLNYHDTVNIVVKDLAKSSVSYSWDGSTLKVDQSESTINGISIVRGAEENVQKFAEYNCDNFTNHKDKLWLAAYIYVCQDTDNIYLGSCDSEKAVRIATKAETAKRLAKPVSIQTSLDKTTATSFSGDETTTVNLGISGTLPIANGGTNSTSAAEACTNLIKSQNINPGTIIIDNPDADKHWLNGTYGIDLQNSDIIGLNALFFADSSDSQSECINFVNTKNSTNDALTTYDRLYAQGGTLYFDPNKKKGDGHNSESRGVVYHSKGVTIPVAKGGTGQTNLDNVTVGTSKKIKTNYYTSATAAVVYKDASITISPKAPTGGADGDIWIVYK